MTALRSASRLAVMIGVLAMAQAHAHHALFVQYDFDREITVEGVVRRSMLGNPHVRIELVGESAANHQDWIAEGIPHTTLLRRGWTGAELKPGDWLRIVGHPSKDGSRILLWQRLYSADGRELWGAER